MNGCDDAIAAFDEVNEHFAAKRIDKNKADLILNFDGIHVSASQLGPIEHSWIARFNANNYLGKMVQKKRLGTEDYEDILSQLFPTSAHDLLEEPCFDIFITSLGTGGIFTTAEAKSISRLSVSRAEFEAGCTWTDIKSMSTKYDANNVAIFDIPTSREGTPQHQRELHQYLQILSEAAVYHLPFHHGFFFPNSRSKLLDYYNAAIHASPLSPHLESYRRSWSQDSLRTLYRVSCIITLLSSWESNTLTDFGIIHAIRGTFIPLPGQARFDASDLSSFLYYRIPSSDSHNSIIPEILALHPEYDSQTGIDFF